MKMSVPQKPRATRKRAAFTGSAKVTLAALSVLGFIGGWDVIARLDHQKEAQASEPAPLSPVVNANRLLQPTFWPTIRPLPELSPIPTLAPTLTTARQLGEALAAGQSGQPIEPAAIQFAPVPTLAPLPALAPLPTLPAPPPPPAPVWTDSGGGGNRSGGS
jgi:hypothetical protein